MKRRCLNVASAGLCVVFTFALALTGPVTKAQVDAGPLLEERDPTHKNYVGPYEYAPDFWKEESITFPDPPQDENLVPFVVHGSRYEHLIDRKSLTLGRDGVTRFVIVLRAGKAKNVLFESLRCESRQYRTLAYGSSNGAFRPRQISFWRTIGKNRGDYRSVLWDEYLCDETGHYRTTDEAVAALLRGN